MSDAAIIDKLVELLAERVAAKLADRKPANDAEYLSTTEAARIASVTPGTIRRWVRSGELTRHEAGARVRIRRDELERLLRCEIVPIDSKLSPEERAARRFG